MKKFSFHGSVTVSAYIEVRANSLEEAREIAGGAGVQGLCHQCSCQRYQEDPEWLIDTDGEVCDIREEGK